MPQIIPIRDLKDTNAISERCKTANEPIFITKNGYGDMVIMSMRCYEERMFMQDVYDKVAQARLDAEEGRLVDAGESLTRIKEQHDLRHP